MVNHAEGYPGFCSMKQLEIFLLLSELDATLLQGYPSIKLAGTHLYTWVERALHCEPKNSAPCPASGQGLNLDWLIWGELNVRSLHLQPSLN